MQKIMSKKKVKKKGVKIEKGKEKNGEKGRVKYEGNKNEGKVE